MLVCFEVQVDFLTEIASPHQILVKSAERFRCYRYPKSMCNISEIQSIMSQLRNKSDVITFLLPLYRVHQMS